MFYKGMSKKSFILFLITLSGCSIFIVGDGMFSVSGDISSESKEDCVIQIIVEGASAARNHYIRSVSGKFEVNFTVSPEGRKYIIEVACSGRVVRQKIVRYPDDMGVGGKVQLGKIS